VPYEGTGRGVIANTLYIVRYVAQESGHLVYPLAGVSSKFVIFLAHFGDMLAQRML